MKESLKNKFILLANFEFRINVMCTEMVYLKRCQLASLTQECAKLKMCFSISRRKNGNGTTEVTVWYDVLY